MVHDPRDAHDPTAGPVARGAARSSAAAGADHHAKLVVELEDVFGGATRRVTLRAPHWDASGQVAMAERTLEVTIPAGARSGELIRLRGLGEPGRGGAEPGDLYLEVHIRPHARFELRGADLRAELPVAPWEAALGASVPLEMPDGSLLRVPVPAEVQSGQVLTVRGRGLPGRAGPGNLELTVRVLLPSPRQPHARRLYEAMAEELRDFDARRAASEGAGRRAVSGGR